MIGEHSVRIEELTALNIRTEGCKHIGCVKSADSVSCVNNDLEACKRLENTGYEVVYLRPDEGGKISESDLKEAIDE